MTGPDRQLRRRDQDEDPTGVHALLSSLPEPGPMPEDLVRRINDSLREEGLRRGEAPDQVSYALFAGRSSRRRRPWLAAAAAAAAVVFLGGGVLTGFGGNMPSQLGMLRSATQTTPSAAATDSPSAGDPLDEPSGGSAPTGSGPGLAGADRGGGVARGPQTFVVSGVAYAPSSLRTQARMLRASPPAQMRTLAAEAPSAGPIATPVGLASCLRALGLPSDAAVMVDMATYDDKPVAVIVTRLDGVDRVYVVRRPCTESNPQLVTGPYQL